MTSDMPWRLPAEWEPQQYVLLSWPHADTDWAYMLPQATDCFVNIAVEIAKRAKLAIVAPDSSLPRRCLQGRVADDRLLLIECETNDTWARDFGMICTVANGAVCINDFKFNGWGLKFASDHDNLITRHILEAGACASDAYYANLLNFVLEGGSIDCDGAGTILTTSECLLSPNRNGAYDRRQIENFLLCVFHVNRILWLEHGALAGDDTDSHIDTLARFLPGKVIAYSSCDRPEDPEYPELEAMATELKALRTIDGQPYKLLPLPIPRAIYDENGMRLPATYANFLLINGALLLPIYADDYYDSMAIERLAECLPDYEIVPIDCRALICQHGSLHCVTMQIPAGVLNT